MTLILDAIKTFKKYDELQVKNEVPMFRIPLHALYKQEKTIHSFNFESLVQRDIVITSRKNEGIATSTFVFLGHFGTCRVLRGLQSEHTEFNILCGIEKHTNSICWIYLDNKEYCDLLLSYHKSESVNSENHYKTLSVGKVYEYNNGLVPINVYRYQSVNIRKLDSKDSHGHYSLIGTDLCAAIENGDQFLVLEKLSTFDSIAELEQLSTPFESRYKLYAESMIRIIGVGKEIMGYCAPHLYTTSMAFQPIKSIE